MVSFGHPLLLCMAKKIIIILVCAICCLSFIYPKEEQWTDSITQKLVMDQYNKIDEKSNLFGILSIPTLNLEQPIYPKSSKENQVDKNVMLLEYEDDFLALAAHSGNGTHAYFRNLDAMPIGTSISIKKDGRTMEYIYFSKEEVLKTGTIYLTDYPESMLILITCSKTKAEIQEVYYAKLAKIYL